MKHEIDSRTLHLGRLTRRVGRAMRQHGDMTRQNADMTRCLDDWDVRPVVVMVHNDEMMYRTGDKTRCPGW